MKGKVQTNQYKVNVLVQVFGGNSSHYSTEDFEVELEIMSDDEVRAEYAKQRTDPTIEEMKDKLKTISGFATSNVYEKEFDVGYDTLVRYKEIKYDEEE